MKRSYDYVFVTHLPAFYKVNLYNALAKRCRIYVIFLGQSSQIRAKDFAQVECQFDYCILEPDHFEQRQRLKNIGRLYRLCRQLDYRKLVVGGWELIEFWALVFFSPQDKNALALESSSFESKSYGWRGFIKKQFLKRIGTVFSSGTPHQKLLEALQFKGQIQKTLGVGIFNYLQKMPQTTLQFTGKFLTVARLAPEKNLLWLMDVFRTLPQFQLTLVGHGPLQAELAAKCPSNVKLLGHVSQDKLAQLYQQHEVFILPSLAEPWGLVVEEALYYGLPVLASQRVGCATDLVEKQQVGALFDPCDPHSLRQAMSIAQSNYEQWIKAVQKLDFVARDQFQIQQYVEGLR